MSNFENLAPICKCQKNHNSPKLTQKEIQIPNSLIIMK